MATETSAKTAVIVVNYGDPALIAANLVRVEGPGIVVIVVDNFHSGSARALTQSLCEQRNWMFVPAPNDGFGAGVNRGIEAARTRGCRIFVLLNPDAVALPEVVIALSTHVARDPWVLVSPHMDSSDGRPHFRGAQVSMRTGQIRSRWSRYDDDAEWRNWLSGACLALSAEAFDRLGGMSEDFFLYWEDVDISRRAVELGMRLEVRSDLLVVHDEGGSQGSSGSRAKSSIYYYYNIRNRTLFGRRMLRGRAWARWVLNIPRQSALIWLRGGKKQAFTHPRGVWASVRGVLAGMQYVVHAGGRQEPERFSVVATKDSD